MIPLSVASTNACLDFRTEEEEEDDDDTEEEEEDDDDMGDIPAPSSLPVAEPKSLFAAPPTLPIFFKNDIAVSFFEN